MLNLDEIHLLLDLLSYETRYEFQDGRYRVVERVRGYSDNRVIGGVQAKLSIMGEAAAKAKR